MRFLRPVAFAFPFPLLCLATTVAAVALCLPQTHADDSSVWSDRIETNFTVDGQKWGMGGRAYFDHDATQLITRYRINDRYAAQFRWVTQTHGESVDYRFRLQRNDLKRGIFFWHTRVELRLKESTTDTIRLRPQTGLKFPVSDKIQGYYKLEPHLEFDLSSQSRSFKFVRHLVGFDFRPHQDLAYGPFLKFETDEHWSPNVAYVGFQVHLALQRE